MVGVEAEDEKDVWGGLDVISIKLSRTLGRGGKCHNVFKSIFLEVRVSHSVIQCLPTAKP